MSLNKPIDVGIVDIDIYFPRFFVSQEELEMYDDDSGKMKGKYTIGLGQKNMAFCDDREDITSICLTVVSNLIKKRNISLKDIGRLEVGTETIQDHAKSIKTSLMTLFEKDNSDIEGVDCINACYGGTSALFNSVAWIQSEAWDGRYALVVAADIAEYAKGPARPTGGCSAVAILIGPNSSLVIQPIRASNFIHAYDFWKPNMDSPYPEVDGKFSNTCYLSSLDKCYNLYCEKLKKRNNKEISLIDFDYVIFHSPYNKLVRKSLARLFFIDFFRFKFKHQKILNNSQWKHLSKFDENVLKEYYDNPESNKDIEKTCITASNEFYEQKVELSTLLPREIGNSYCASLYSALISIIANIKNGNRLLLFSYGSGVSSTLFELSVKNNIISKTTAIEKLNFRIKISPKIFENTLLIRESHYSQKGEFIPSCNLGELYSDTWVLKKKDEKGRRLYKKNS